MEVKVDRTLVHVVDDNATFRKTIEGRLEQFGYAVSTYPSAQHLLDCLPKTPHRVVSFSTFGCL